MGKILLCGDQHIHPHSNQLAKMDECLRTFEWIYRVASERKITQVVSLGDLFHDRERINTLAYHRAYDIILKAKERGITTHLLLGNHDMYLRESFSVHSLRALGQIAEIIDGSQRKEIEGLGIDFLPFVLESKVSLNKYFPTGGRSRILCSHLAVSGGSLNKLWGAKYLDEYGIKEGEFQADGSEFEGYEKVFLGHFHSRQNFGPSNKIYYIGSPLQLNFGDAMDPRGIGILDTNSLEIEFIENTFSPRYFILPYNEDLSKYPLKGSHVRLVVPTDFGSVNIIETREKIQKDFEPADLSIVALKTEGQEAIKEKLETSIAFTENKPELLKKYLGQVVIPPALDPKLLLKVGLEMASL